MINRLVVNLTLPYPPSGNRSARHTRGGHHYVPEEVRAYREAVAWAAVGRQRVVGPCAIRVDLFPRLTLKGQVSQRRIDLDNCLKVVLDAIQHAGLIGNDRSVEMLVAELRREGTRDGGVGVMIWERQA